MKLAEALCVRADLQKRIMQVDSLSAELRKVDLKIQESNWMFELKPLT